MIYFRILGPVYCGTPIETPKLRSFAAALMLHPNQDLSYDRLSELLWGEPPDSAKYNLRTYALRLRRALSGAGLGRRLVTRRGGAGGYRLAISSGELDREVFTRLVHSGRAEMRGGWPERAAGSLRRALDLWCGPAGEDVPSDTPLHLQLRLLDEERLDAIEDYAQARIAFGDTAALIFELSSLSAAHPLREQLWNLLMRAQYLDGNPPAALSTFDRARAVFADQLGIDVSPALRQLQVAVLRHDVGAIRVPHRAPARRLVPAAAR